MDAVPGPLVNCLGRTKRLHSEIPGCLIPRCIVRLQMTKTPAAGVPARAMGFERDQRMRDLSMRIQQQDLQIRLNNQR